MLSNILAIATLIAWASVAGLFAWYAAGAASKIAYVTLADGRRQERRLPFVFRILLPLTPNLKSMMLNPNMEKVRQKTDAMLVTAGYEGLLSGWEFLSLKVLVPLSLSPLLWLTAHLLTLSLPAIRPAFFLLCLMSMLLTALYPAMWLKSAVKLRKGQILRAMPFVLDLLTLSVEAGLDFMTAMQRSTERPTIDPLSEELLRVVREIQVGHTRRKALKAMSVRIDIPDMRSVVNALVQADELGVSIGSILRIQSDQIRIRRFERAEKLANEAPVKLLAPLMIFIFPSVFLILLGPVIFKLIQQM